MAGKTILVVEPNTTLSQTMIEEIVSQGFKPLLAQTPEDAVNLALTRFPHLLLLHLSPDLALNLLHKLAQVGCLLPAILVVEPETSQLKVDFLRLGVRDYLISPFTGEQLTQVISRLSEEDTKVNLPQQAEMAILPAHQQSPEGMEQLIKMGRSIHSLLDEEAVLSRITEAAVELTEAEEGYLLLLDTETGVLWVRAEQHLGEQQAQCLNLRVKDNLADSVISSGKPILLSGSKTQPLKIRTGYLVKSLINVPLKVNEHIIGVLGVSSRESNRYFTSTDLYQLLLLGEMGAVALENARLYTEMRTKLIRRVREFATLQALATQLGIITDFEVGAQLVLSFVLKATSAEAGVLAWAGNESKDKLIYASQGVLGESVLSHNTEITQHIWWDERIIQETLETGKAKLWHNLSMNGRVPYSNQVQARLTVPLRQGRQIVGVINLESSTADTFTEDDLHFVRSVADQVTIALKSTLLQQQVETSQTHFSLLMEAVNNGVWLVDANLNLLAHNQAATKLMGWWSMSPIGQTLSEFLPSEGGSSPKLCQLITQAMEERQSVLFDKGIILSTKEKQSVLLGGRVFPVIQGDQTVGTICSFWKVADEFSDPTTRFEFADMASHLLRTPLNLIHTSVDLLMNSKLDVQAQHKTLKRMKEQSQRLTDFTNELLKMLRLEVEGTQVHPERVYLPDLVERVVSLIQEERFHHTFSFTAPAGMPMVMADPTKTELILLNLLLSAARRCPHEGYITVTLQHKRSEIIVAVSDNGSPLQNTQLNRIFQQFYPVDDGYNKLPSTYHLGLYTTKRLVELQNGRIWAKSQPGHGSQFYFSLPIWE